MQRTFAATSTVKVFDSAEDSPRHFNFASHDRSRETTDSPNDTETEQDSPYTPLYTPSFFPRTPVTSPDTPSPQLARTNAMTSMTRMQVLTRRRSRTVSYCPIIQHSMSFPPTSAADSPLRHSTTDLELATTVVRSSSDKEQSYQSRRPTLTRQRSLSCSDDNKDANEVKMTQPNKPSLDNYLIDFLQHGTLSPLDHSEDELETLPKSRSDSTIDYGVLTSRNSSIHTIPSVESILEENGSNDQETTRPLSPSFPRSLRNSRLKIPHTDETGTLRKRENAFRQIRKNRHKNKRFLTDSALERTDKVTENGNDEVPSRG